MCSVGNEFLCYVWINFVLVLVYEWKLCCCLLLCVFCLWCVDYVFMCLLWMCCWWICIRFCWFLLCVIVWCVWCSLVYVVLSRLVWKCLVIWRLLFVFLLFGCVCCRCLVLVYIFCVCCWWIWIIVCWVVCCLFELWLVFYSDMVF